MLITGKRDRLHTGTQLPSKLLGISATDCTLPEHGQPLPDRRGRLPEGYFAAVAGDPRRPGGGAPPPEGAEEEPPEVAKPSVLLTELLVQGRPGHELWL